VITRDDDQAGWSVYAMDAAKDAAARDKGRAAYQDFLTFLGASGQAGWSQLNFAYSALACFRVGMSGSASFPVVVNRLYR
jgi:hypothetical protein